MEKNLREGHFFIERLQRYMEYKGVNDNQMTVTAGLSVGLIGKAKNSNKGMNALNIEKILLAYPDLNSEWLLTGQGEMLKSKRIAAHTPSRPPASEAPEATLAHKATQNSAPMQDTAGHILDRLLTTLAEKDAIILRQAEELGRLRQQVEQLQEALSHTPPDTPK